MQDNEQWLYQGDCSKCRRFSYCSKPCTRHKRMVDSRIRLSVLHAMNEMTGINLTDFVIKGE